ncbi:MAG: hypothetical protein WAQ27_03385 [Candidatus Microsaccharimonas sp.]
MSQEYFDETQYQTVDTMAVNSFNEARQYQTSLTKFLQTIFDKYEQAPDGAAELIRLRRVAQFITHNSSASFNNEVQAVFNGQLMGLQILNYIDPAEAPATDYSHLFMKDALKGSQEGIVVKGEAVQDPSTGRYIRPTAEPVAAQQQRLWNLAEQMRFSLSEMSADSRLSDAYEDFIHVAASELYEKNTELHDLTKVGFRLILKQYEFYTGDGSDDDPYADREDDSAVETATESIQATPSASRESYLPSDKSLAEITGMPNETGSLDLLVDIENINDDTLKILEKFNELIPIADGLNMSDDKVADATYELLEEELEKFNIENDLINPDDMLLISGDFYAFASDGEDGAITRYENHVEIRGIYNGLSVIDMPSNKELQRMLNRRSKGDTRDLPNKLAMVPAIQLDDVVILTYDGESEDPEITHLTGLTLDIPVHYESVDFQILRAPALDS